MDIFLFIGRKFYHNKRCPTISLCLGKIIDVSFRQDESSYLFVLISQLFSLSFCVSGTHVNMRFHIKKW